MTTDLVATDFQLNYLLEKAEKSVQDGDPLATHLISATLLAKICGELKRLRGKKTTKRRSRS